MALERLKYWIVVPEAGRNYVHNPRHDTPDGITGFTVGGGASTIALVDEEQRRGAFSCKLTPVADTFSYVQYGTVPVVSGRTYTFSVDVKCVAGEPIGIYIRDGVVTNKASTIITSTGNWQRVQVTWTSDATASTYTVRVARGSTSSNTFPVYVDGWQYEEADEATTFMHGYAGEGHYWEGAARNSDTIRTAFTGMGGRLVDIEDYAHKVISDFGFGMGNYDQIMTEMANGGSLYQQHILKSRNISLLLLYSGDIDDMYRDRNAILDMVRPDRLPGQLMKLRFQGFDNSGNEATNPIDIICAPQSSHLDTPNEATHQKTLLNFTVPSGLFQGAFEEGGELDLYEEFDDADYIMTRDRDGQWAEMRSGGAGLNGIVYCMAEAPNGDIYVGGAFTNAGGVAAADNIAKWDGSAWTAVGAPSTGATITDVRAMVFDAAGNLYIGGAFLNLAGIAAADYLAKWDGTNWSALTNWTVDSASRVYSLVIDPDSGDLIVGGDFTEVASDAAINGITRWDGTNWHNIGTANILGRVVYGLVYDHSGNLYATGDFSTIGSVANTARIAKWNGTSWSALSTGLNAQGFSLAVDANNVIYAGGQFTTAGGRTVNYIASWNGSRWSSLGSGVNNIVYHVSCPKNKSGEVYVCGQFTAAGSLSLTDRVAIWRAGAWGRIDIDLPGSSPTSMTLTDRAESFYICGNYTGTAKTGKIAINTVGEAASANSYCFIQIHGPGRLQSIINYTTGKSIQFWNLSLLAGEWINMILDPQQIAMTSSWRGNCLRYIIPGSDHGDFYLAPGENHISVFLPGGTDVNSAGFMNWSPRYWSIEGARHD